MSRRYHSLTCQLEQEERIEAYAHSKGWRVCTCYEDEGFSGFQTYGPRLERLLQDAEDHKFERVLALQMGTLARRVDDFIDVVADLADVFVEVVSVTETFETSTVEGRLSCVLLATFAQWERMIPVRNESLDHSAISAEAEESRATRLLRRSVHAFVHLMKEQAVRLFAPEAGFPGDPDVRQVSRGVA